MSLYDERAEPEDPLCVFRHSLQPWLELKYVRTVKPLRNVEQFCNLFVNSK